MLSRIEIRNFAIIQSLDLDCANGMTVITGETGAGKSIVIDALGLTLGERAEQLVIYPGAKQAEVTSIFDLKPASAASQWLVDQQLDEDGECILRRVVIRDGKSKCFINGRSVTQSQLKALGVLLVDIHGQHAHQTLLKSKEQLNLLDRYASHPELIAAVKQSAQSIKTIAQRHLELQQLKQARDAQFELLSYQVEELSLANPEEAILKTLEAEHRQAATSQDRLELVEMGLVSLADEDDNSALSAMARVIDKVSKLSALDNRAANMLETLTQAQELLREASHELSDYQNSLDSDPQRLQQLDNQLEVFHDLARKHRVSLAELPAHFESLKTQLKQLNDDETELVQIEQARQDAEKTYQQHATKLSQSRAKVAQKLQPLITDKIQALAMSGGQIQFQLSANETPYSASGSETLEILVSANPGQPLQPLNKVASGGELSRISLAIAVITAQQQLVPTLIFDEVDVGIGGGTAETVGHLLHQLAKQRQVICVTHQPQVAACGDQHLIASKTKQLNATTTRLDALTEEQRIQEIARMLGGLTISATTLSHAREMLKI